MPNEKPFIFRKPGESQDDAGDRISKELQEERDPEATTPKPDEPAPGQAEAARES